jgi:hypothetical protein
MAAEPYDKDDWRASVSNGQIAGARLAEITPRQYDPDLAGPAIMHPEAAAAMSALLAAAPTGLAVKYSYRTLAKQWEKWQSYQNGGTLAAYPGTSNHGWAVAVDLTGLGTAQLLWLRNNAGRFHFLNDVISENWHYTYQGGFTPPEEDDDVNLDKYIEGGDKYRDRYKQRAADGKKDPDPGPPPDDMDDRYAKAGWNDARFSGAWPKG